MAASRDTARTEAADWFSRLRAPGGEQLRAAFEAWRDADPGHDEAYRYIEQRWDQSAFLRHSDLVANRDLGRATIWHRRPVVRAALAASLALALLAAFGITRVWHDRTPATAIAATMIATPQGQVRAVSLADGSHLTLDADTAVRVQISGSQRRVTLLRGRARFAVVARRVPFSIGVGGVEIRCTGATIDVDQGPGGVNIAVIDGTADVLRDPAGNAAALHLSALQQVDAGLDRVPRSADPASFDWPRGVLVFDGERLDAAIAYFARYGPPAIRLADPALGALRITGGFHRNDPAGFAQAVAALFHLSLDVRADRSLILGPPQKS